MRLLVQPQGEANVALTKYLLQIQDIYNGRFRPIEISVMSGEYIQLGSLIRCSRLS